MTLNVLNNFYNEFLLSELRPSYTILNSHYDDKT